MVLSFSQTTVVITLIITKSKVYNTLCLLWWRHASHCDKLMPYLTLSETCAISHTATYLCHTSHCHISVPYLSLSQTCAILHTVTYLRQTSHCHRFESASPFFLSLFSKSMSSPSVLKIDNLEHVIKSHLYTTVASALLWKNSVTFSSETKTRM